MGQRPAQGTRIKSSRRGPRNGVPVGTGTRNEPPSEPMRLPTNPSAVPLPCPFRDFGRRLHRLRRLRRPHLTTSERMKIINGRSLLAHGHIPWPLALVADSRSWRQENIGRPGLRVSLYSLKFHCLADCFERMTWERCSDHTRKSETRGPGHVQSLGLVDELLRPIVLSPILAFSRAIYHDDAGWFSRDRRHLPASRCADQIDYCQPRDSSSLDLERQAIVIPRRHRQFYARL